MSSSVWLADGALAIDVNAPDRTAPLGDPLAPVGPLVGAVVVAAMPDALARPAAGGGLLVHPDLVWSLLDPISPRPPDDLSPRALAEHWWRRLAWWQGRDPMLRAACGRLLETGQRGAGRLIEALDHLAAAGSPFGGWSEPAPGVPARAPATPPPTGGDPTLTARWMVAPEGLGALYGGFYTPRPEQGDLAAAVGSALDDGVALLAEAGTGVGKTLGYLVPLVARLAAGGRRAVVSTHTRALQSQILDHDLPLLAPTVPQLKARLLMGRQNYLCHRQLEDYLARPVEDLRDAARAAAFRVWLTATVDGMRDELAVHPLLAPDVGLLFDSVRPCSPAQCHEGDRCYVTRARRLARGAELVVVNHALLVTDLVADGMLIGPYDWLVVDEAHRLPGAALDVLAIRCDRQRRTALVDLLGEPRLAAEGQPEVAIVLAGRLRAAADGEQAAAACADFGRAAGRALAAFDAWWNALALQVQGELDLLESAGRLRVRDREVAFAPLRQATVALRETAALAAAGGAALAQRVENLEELPPTAADLLLQTAQASQLFGLLEHDVRFLTEDRQDPWVTWMEPAQRGGLRALGATPLEPGPLLRAFWEDRGLDPIATSATLAVGEDFDFMLRELGLAGRRPHARTLVVPTPFDWERQALVLALEDMPAPDGAVFAAAIADVVVALRRCVSRQTLVLFTSYRLLEAVAAQLQTVAGEVIVQTPRASAADLLARFRRSEGALLLGTSTFWEGIDLPGRALEVLVVTKLPFLVPSDPWVAARCERLQAAGENAFTVFMVRDAVLRLRQGMGRLLRRDSDRGVVVLLDNRLHTKPYGATFLGALPARPRFARDVADLAERVGEFFGPEPS
jgi:DNA polymerase-3 subunit epsilon